LPDTKTVVGAFLTPNFEAMLPHRCISISLKRTSSRNKYQKKREERKEKEGIQRERKEGRKKGRKGFRGKGGKERRKEEKKVGRKELGSFVD